jgi:hypothetical protein
MIVPFVVVGLLLEFGLEDFEIALTNSPEPYIQQYRDILQDEQVEELELHH